MPRAVLFDLGGVVLGSPFTAIARSEQQHGLPGGFVTGTIAGAGEQGAFQRLERGELDVAGFAVAFARECGDACPVDGAALIEAIVEEMVPRSAFLAVIREIRARGVLAAALTNNWKDEPAMQGLAPYFDHFFESCRLGMRKPDPRIYRFVCEQLRVAPSEVVYLDDIGGNLKPARELGMTTILVRGPEQALTELRERLGLDV
jgi:epoxide hydrolase-like predicted phosphatase